MLCAAVADAFIVINIINEALVRLAMVVYVGE